MIRGTVGTERAGTSSETAPPSMRRWSAAATRTGASAQEFLPFVPGRLCCGIMPFRITKLQDSEQAYFPCYEDSRSRRHQADDAGPLRMAMILVPRLSCYPEDLPKKELSVIIDKSGDFGEYDHQAPCEQDRECGITSLICERTTGSGESVHEKPAGGR